LSFKSSSKHLPRHKVSLPIGSAIAQVVGHWLLTMEACVQSRGNACGGGYVEDELALEQNPKQFRFPLPIIIPPFLRAHLLSGTGAIVQYMRRFSAAPSRQIASGYQCVQFKHFLQTFIFRDTTLNIQLCKNFKSCVKISHLLPE
jgi:hypothetical protein